MRPPPEKSFSPDPTHAQAKETSGRKRRRSDINVFRNLPVRMSHVAWERGRHKSNYFRATATRARLITSELSSGATLARSTTGDSPESPLSWIFSLGLFLFLFATRRFAVCVFFFKPFWKSNQKRFGPAGCDRLITSTGSKIRRNRKVKRAERDRKLTWARRPSNIGRT